ncbi:MAG TPA: hypothetical protein ENO30_01985, partial [Thermodesulfobium narugense]|nr:hypothetical protein [Thermodesulfobium narugense]
MAREYPLEALKDYFITFGNNGFKTPIVVVDSSDVQRVLDKIAIVADRYSTDTNIPHKVIKVDPVSLSSGTFSITSSSGLKGNNTLIKEMVYKASKVPDIMFVYPTEDRNLSETDKIITAGMTDRVQRLIVSSSDKDITIDAIKMEMQTRNIPDFLDNMKMAITEELINYYKNHGRMSKDNPGNIRIRVPIENYTEENASMLYDAIGNSRFKVVYGSFYAYVTMDIVSASNSIEQSSTYSTIRRSTEDVFQEILRRKQKPNFHAENVHTKAQLEFIQACQEQPQQSSNSNTS